MGVGNIFDSPFTSIHHMPTPPMGFLWPFQIPETLISLSVSAATSQTPAFHTLSRPSASVALRVRCRMSLRTCLASWRAGSWFHNLVRLVLDSILYLWYLLPFYLVASGFRRHQLHVFSLCSACVRLLMSRGKEIFYITHGSKNPSWPVETFVACPCFQNFLPPASHAGEIQNLFTIPMRHSSWEYQFVIKC